MEKRWIIAPTPEADKVQELSKALNINPSLAALLIQRGITDFDEAKDYFRPQLSHLHSPWLMRDMDKAVKRLQHAIQNHQKILVYGDYDVDGTTSVTLVFDFLRQRYAHIDFYIPDRYTEGYGISYIGIDWAKENNFELIIALDCGVKSVAHIAYANERNIDFIICDHHRPGDVLPQAAAVLDPKRDDCEYPYKELSGCGVGFKLMQAYCLAENIPAEELYPYLDLAVVSIASDIVPITGENRVMAYFGLQQICKAPRAGLRALLDVAGIKPDDISQQFKLQISNLVFGVGPRINAAGRIAHAKAAVELLLANDKDQAAKFAEGINLRNDERRDFDSTITQQALEMIAEDPFLQSSKSTVLFRNDWHKGVIGIVASRCIEKYYRPTIVLTESNQKATGSARSVAGFDVYEAISECSDLLEQFGGHTHAAGLTLSLDKVQIFREKFEKVVQERITPEQTVPQIDIDGVLPLNQITQSFYNIVKQMSPFGPQNMQPVFMSEGVIDTGYSRVLEGKNGKNEHLKLSVCQENGGRADAIAFGMAEFYPQIATKKPFNICYTIEENHFRGNVTLQLMIKDIQF
jgi:single-stranded-DNA-specific exonuclease